MRPSLMARVYRRVRPNSIPGKLASLFALVIGAIAAFFFIYFPATLAEHSNAALQGKAQSVGRMAAFSVRSALIFDDPEAMKEAMAGGLENDDLLYLAVVDTAGRVVVAIQQSGGGQNDAHNLVDESARAGVHRVREPIVFKGDTLGFVHVGISMDQVQRDLAESRGTAAMVSILIFLLGMSGVVGVSVLVTKPLHQMVDTAHRIAAGNLSERADIDTRDEVGDLAQVFNMMVGRLQAAQEDLEEANRELEGRVEKRTRQWRESQHQLQQAQKMEAVGRLAAGVAHDFNNLLTVISGHSELLLLDVGPEHPFRESVTSIASAGSSAAALTQQLLAFSRKQVLQPKVLDLNEVVAHLIKMLGRLLGEDIELTIEPASKLGAVMADPGQMEQVILNLAVNARDAMPHGGTLRIATRDRHVGRTFAGLHTDLERGDYVEIRITDTGHGMSSETQARAFEPFFSTKPESRGTGLGLSTVYGIVKQSGGSILLESSPEGTAFSILLPRVSSHEQPPCLEGCPEKREGGTETVLLVEDSTPVRQLAARMLEQSGYRVLEAACGQAALALCNASDQRIDLLLTDVVMPGMSGRELAEAVKPLRPKMAVLYMSGYTDDQAVLRGVRDQDMAFLEKPFTLNRLLSKVRDVLGETGLVVG